MDAFFSFAQRKANEGVDFLGNQYDLATMNGRQQAIDPWNLGVTTSTSTAESSTLHNNSDDTLLSVSTPQTPEGLRSRKSIQRIRKDIFGSYHYRNEINSRHKLPTTTTGEPKPIPATQRIHRDSSTLQQMQSTAPAFSAYASSFGREPGLAVLPPTFRGNSDRSSIDSSSSFYGQSVEEIDHVNDEDFEMHSSLECSFTRRSRPKSGTQQVAISPNLKRGGKAKTAVGALLVAMAETSAKPERKNMLGKNGCNTEMRNETSRHSILPSRTWMENHPMEDEYLVDRHPDEDDTICDDLYQHTGYKYPDDDDNQSSRHASPSSLRRKAYDASWANRRAQFEHDTSFTRRILGDDPSSSRLEERSIVGDHSPYNFNSIMTEEIHGDTGRETVGAPRILSLIKDNDGTDLSAISSSYHQNGIQSVNTSMADTMDDEDDEYQEIPKYYQALPDDIPAHNDINDGALLLAKAQNQRHLKEDLLRSTFERLQGSLNVLKEVYSQSTVVNSLFLGMGKTSALYYSYLETLLSGLQEGGSDETRRGALIFCMSVLQNTEAFSNSTIDHHSKFPKSRWIPIPGFHSSLGLEEEPQSPPSVTRGADTSLFSLPSDSANNSTPHTSNVSITSTLTTIVSPEKYGSDIYKQKLSMRKTVESLAQLLHRLEASCMCLKSGMTTTEKSTVIENIQLIYFELIKLPAVDLEQIIDSFEMDSSKQRSLTRKVSTDQDVAAFRLMPPPYSCYENELNVVQQSIPFTRDDLRINIMQCDDDDVDNDNRNQSIECDLWTPTTNDMRSLISPESMEASTTATNGGYAILVDSEEPVDDLRRTTGSFDRDSLEEIEEEREAAPLNENEDQHDHIGSFPATFAPRVVAQRSRKSRFWKKGFKALKNRGRQVTAE